MVKLFKHEFKSFETFRCITKSTWFEIYRDIIYLRHLNVWSISFYNFPATVIRIKQSKILLDILNEKW